MVIGTADVGEIRAAADASSHTLGRDVNVWLLTPDEWDSSQHGFVAHLRSEPLVELQLLQSPGRPRSGHRVPAAAIESRNVATEVGA